MRNTIWICVWMLIAIVSLQAQPMERGTGLNAEIKGEIKGKVIDKSLNKPVEYTNVAIYSVKDSSLVTGVISDGQGTFLLKNIPAGKFYIQLRFIGYKTETINDLVITPRNSSLDLGVIGLKQSTTQMEGVEVVADKRAIQYKIDKKVINVSQFYTATSGTAVDVLERTPSVTVDVEGNVSLRGSSNFTVLIDGRPSPLSGSDALDQIPASTIENIEIVTNPSAKYDPEGTSGIINIISKKNKLEGLSGLINTNLGINKKYGGDILLNYRSSFYNFYIGGEYNNRNFYGERVINNQTTYEGVTSFNYSSGDGDRLRESSNIKTGVDFFLTKKTTFSAGISYGTRNMDRIGDLLYHTWKEPGGAENYFRNKTDAQMENRFLTTTSSLIHKFNNKGHEVTADFYYRNSDRNQIDFNNLFTEEGLVTSGKNSIEDGEENEIRIKLDYSLPMGENNKFEAGYQSELEDSRDTYRFEEYNTVTGLWEFEPLFSHDVESKENTHALYSTFSATVGDFGSQLGFRAELTDRSIVLTETGEDFTLNKWDYFPSLHLSYNLPKDQQLMTSYSRRINRPRSWYLEPFQSFMDAYNIRSGNPSLKPEYIDSYEAGYTKKLGRSFFSFEAYHRKTNNKIERTRTSYNDSIMFNSFENVGKDFSSGAEIMLNLQLLKWWNLNLSGNAFHYKVEGVLYDQNFSEESFNWNVRGSNTFNLGKTNRLQLDGRYVSPSVTAQGRREGYFFTNAAYKHDFLGRKLTATLQVRDIFGTSKHEFYSSGPDFNTYLSFKRESPVVMLNLSFKINNYKNKRNERNQTNGDEEPGGDLF